jgi:hypothetical protein
MNFIAFLKHCFLLKEVNSYVCEYYEAFKDTFFFIHFMIHTLESLKTVIFVGGGVKKLSKKCHELLKWPAIAVLIPILFVKEVLSVELTINTIGFFSLLYVRLLKNFDLTGLY